MKTLLPKKMRNRYTKRAQQVLVRMFRYGESQPQLTDLLHAIAQEEGSLGANILAAHNITQKTLGIKDRKSTKKDSETAVSLELSADLKKTLKRSAVLASRHNNTYIGTEHLVAALAETPSFKKILGKKKAKILVPKLQEQIASVLSTNAHFPGIVGEGDSSLLSSIQNSHSGKKGRRKKKGGLFSGDPFGGSLPHGQPGQDTAGALDYFTQDLVERAEENELDPLIGREKEVERLISILSRRRKNNPVLIGEAGVGKTAIVHGLAERITNHNIPPHLVGRRLLSLDLGMLIAGTVFRGEFEGRLKDVITEAEEEDAILFIDEMHTIMGAGAAQGSLDAANMLKPAISQGDLQIVGATTTDEFRKHIEKDPALERRFQPIMVAEPTIPETVSILKGLREKLSRYHRVALSDETLERAVYLADRFVHKRYFPDKAIDVIDEAAARLRSSVDIDEDEQRRIALDEKLKNIRREKENAIQKERYEEALQLKVQEERLKKERESFALNAATDTEKTQERELTLGHIEKVVSEMSGVALERIGSSEKEKLLNLEERLREYIVGQDKAVKAVSAALRRSRSGIKERSRPIGSFLFLGPSGVGKTELARVLARTFFGSSDALIKLDMSEFSESHTVSKLLGAPAGYIGHDDDASIFERVRQRPYSLVLFDEIEKAHPKVHNLLLQIMEDGVVTDAHGRAVNFQNTLVILTSNIGSARFWQEHAIGFGDEPHSQKQKEVRKDVHKHLKPELVSRLDHTIVFRPLGKKDVARIVELELDKLAERLKEQGITFSYWKRAVRYIAKKAHSKDHGARKVRSKIRSLVEDPLAHKIISDEIASGQKVTLKGSKKKGLSWRIENN